LGFAAPAEDCSLTACQEGRVFHCQKPANLPVRTRRLCRSVPQSWKNTSDLPPATTSRATPNGQQPQRPNVASSQGRPAAIAFRPAENRGAGRATVWLPRPGSCDRHSQCFVESRAGEERCLVWVGKSQPQPYKWPARRQAVQNGYCERVSVPKTSVPPAQTLHEALRNGRGS